MTITSLAGATTAPAPGPIVTEPGIYELTNGQYHADPVPGGSLSSTGARKLLPPSCPALYRHEQIHGRPPKKQFDFGHAAHKLVLGDGPELRKLNFDNLLTKAAKAERDAAYADGAVPLLGADWDKVQAMADAIRQHPIASALFNPLHGTPEQSLFWTDDPTGVWRRARLDWLPTTGTTRMIVPDYKTTVSAAPDAISRAINDYGYHQQAAWYLDAVRALDLADHSAVFVFVFQEKTAPYLVNVVQLDQIAMRIGRERNRRAIAAYQACTTSGQWPAYSDRIEIVSLPAWAEKQESSQ